MRIEFDTNALSDLDRQVLAILATGGAAGLHVKEPVVTTPDEEPTAKEPVVTTPDGEPTAKEPVAEAKPKRVRRTKAQIEADRVAALEETKVHAVSQSAHVAPEQDEPEQDEPVYYAMVVGRARELLRSGEAGGDQLRAALAETASRLGAPGSVLKVGDLRDDQKGLSILYGILGTS